MSDEKRRILEMVSEGKITEKQAEELLEALEDGEEQPEEKPDPALDAEEYSRVYSEAYEKVYEPAFEAAFEKYGPESERLNSEVEGIAEQARAAAQKAVGEAQGEKAAGIGAELLPPVPAMPAAPAMPAMPIMPAKPDGGQDIAEYQRKLDEYAAECERNMNEYRRQMDEYARRYEEQMAKLRAQAEEQRQAPPQPQPKVTPDDWAGWLSGIGEEIWLGLQDIGRSLGRDLDDAKDDVSEAVSDLKEALGDVVEEWEEELADEQEEMAEEYEDDDEDMEQVVSPDNKPEFIGGEFAYRKWAGLDELEQLEINWLSGGVSICPWDGDHIEVVEYSKKALAPGQECLLMVNSAQKLLSIREYRQKTSPRGVFGNGWNPFNKPSKRLEVFIPREQCGSIEKLRVQSMSGTVQASELSGESFEINAVSGTVLLRSISAETLDAGTVSGSLIVEGCSAEKLNAHSVSGTNSCRGFSAEKAELTTVSGSLAAHGNAEKFKVSTVSGSATLTVDQCPEKANLSSVSGSIKLRLPENAGFTADYSSSSGSFYTDFGAQIKTDGKRKKSGRAVFGNGETKLDLHTTSGSLKILRSDGTSV